MKILFFGWDESMTTESHKVDYLGDSIYHGFKTLFGKDVSTIIPQDHMYKGYDVSKLRGHGFSLYGLLDQEQMSVHTVEDMETNIKNKYYDLVIYSRIFRNAPYYDLVSKYYKDDKIICVDGGDHSSLMRKYLRHHYFKRELQEEPTEKLHPLSFSIPKEKFYKLVPVKTQKISHTINPLGEGRRYQFIDEEKYYEDYRKSYFGQTSTRNGWEALRYIEIISQKCIPLIQNLANCPTHTMHDLPKNLLKSVHIDMAEELYWDYLQRIFLHCYKNQTTEAVAKRILRLIKND